MKTPLYREAITHSWQLVWKHKMLWLFGLFAAFLGQMGLMDLLSNVGFASSDYALYPSWLAWPQLLKSLYGNSGLSLPFEGWIWLIWLVVILLGLFIFFLFTAVVSQGALVYSSDKFFKSKKLPSTSTAWHVGVKHFWRIFFLNLFKKVVMVLLAVVVGYGTWNFVVGASGWSVVLFLLIFLLAVLVGLVLSFLVIYAIGYIVIEEYSLRESLEAAWMLFVDHWLVSIEVGLLVLFLNIILGAVVFLGFWVLFLPVLAIWFFGVVSGSAFLGVAGFFVGLSLFVLFIVWVGSIFSAFTTSIWTYLFVKMHREGLTSRILHWGGFHRK
ncbi:MAG: hypothetical protein WA057_04515 [Candidatus Magasanikiibacteriota bacterium]